MDFGFLSVFVTGIVFAAGAAIGWIAAATLLAALNGGGGK